MVWVTQKKKKYVRNDSLNVKTEGWRLKFMVLINVTFTTPAQLTDQVSDLRKAYSSITVKHHWAVFPLVYWTCRQIIWALNAMQGASLTVSNYTRFWQSNEPTGLHPLGPLPTASCAGDSWWTAEQWNSQTETMCNVCKYNFTYLNAHNDTALKMTCMNTLSNAAH